VSVGFFLGPLRREHLSDRWDRLLTPLPYSFGKELVVVPEGFVCDGPSVPRLPFAYLVCGGGVGEKAGVLHDYLYREGYPRKKADGIFLDALDACGVPSWQRWPMYWAVRMFGGCHYRPRPGVLDPR